MLKSKPLIIKIASALCLILLLATQIGATQATPPPPAPILLVTDATSTNKFGPYLAEILRAEGLNAFEQKDKADLSAADLSGRPAVILAEMTLDTAKADMLTSYVSEGGHLLAMRPAAEIKGIFGLGAATDPPLADGYLKIETNTTFQGSKPGQGLVSETLQLHTAADRYAIDPGTVEFATLYADATTSTVFPAVAGAASGSGWGIAFTYDLATNVIYTRQGNPANANLDIDGDTVLRTQDLFQTAGGGQPWVNLDKVPIPQADEQQRLFARLVRQMVEESHPMPQLWYFPDTAKTMLILTGDAHVPQVDSDYQYEIDSIYAQNQAEITLYLPEVGNPDPEIGGPIPSVAKVVEWQAQKGTGVGIHPRASGDQITNLSEGFINFDQWFKLNYLDASPDITRSKTVRTHQLAWAGWTDAAQYAEDHQIGMDFSYYHWGPWLKTSNNVWPNGFITGSGLPMKFINAGGDILDVYQQLTELSDEHLLGAINPDLENLTPAQAAGITNDLIQSSNAGNYAALVTQFHVDYYKDQGGKEWAEASLANAQAAENNVPTWDADRWLAFTETRHDVDFTNLAWDKTNGKLTFNITPVAHNNPTGPSSENLSVMLPMTYNGLPLLAVKVSGNPATPQIMAVKGENRGFVSAPIGQPSSFEIVYGEAVNPPFPTPTPEPLPYYLPLINAR